MRIVVSGSRTITDVKTVESILQPYISTKDEIVVGDARGVDAIAADLAYRYFNTVEVFKPDWNKWGKAAGPKRNEQMLNTDPDMLVVIWDGKSRGTKHTIDTALKRGIETHVHFVKVSP